MKARVRLGGEALKPTPRRSVEATVPGSGEKGAEVQRIPQRDPIKLGGQGERLYDQSGLNRAAELTVDRAMRGHERMFAWAQGEGAAVKYGPSNPAGLALRQLQGLWSSPRASMPDGGAVAPERGPLHLTGPKNRERPQPDGSVLNTTISTAMSCSASWSLRNNRTSACRALDQRDDLCAHRALELAAHLPDRLSVTAGYEGVLGPGHRVCQGRQREIVGDRRFRVGRPATEVVLVDRRDPSADLPAGGFRGRTVVVQGVSISRVAAAN